MTGQAHGADNETDLPGVGRWVVPEGRKHFSIPDNFAGDRSCFAGCPHDVSPPDGGSRRMASADSCRKGPPGHAALIGVDGGEFR
jgi:hypothetical protein